MAINAEKLIVDWLNADTGLAGWPASLAVPPESSSSHPVRCVTVERVGGGEEPFRSTPLLAVQIWGTSQWDASEAASRLILPRLKRVLEIPEVVDWNVTGMSHLPMPDGRPRYQIIIQLTVKAEDS